MAFLHLLRVRPRCPAYVWPARQVQKWPMRMETGHFEPSHLLGGPYEELKKISNGLKMTRNELQKNVALASSVGEARVNG